MSTRIERLIESHRAEVKDALARGDDYAKWLHIGIICGFKMLLRMEKTPQSCASPPSSFSQYS